jgi:hypothetical protein
MQQSIVIDRPVEVVFAHRALLHRTAEWQRDIIATELLTAGPIGCGTRATETRRGQGDAEVGWELEITEYELNRVLGMVSRRGDLELRERDEFTPVDGNTRYTACIELIGYQLPGSVLQKRTIESLLTLKEQIEGRGAVYLGRRIPVRER